MTNLNSILKSRDITLPTKVYIVKAMVFPIVMYAWESWPIKKGAGNFYGGPVVRNPPCDAGDIGSIPGPGTKIPHAVVHGVAKRQTKLSD